MSILSWMSLMEYLLLLSKLNTVYVHVTCGLSDLILPCFKPTIQTHQCVSLSCLDFNIPSYILSGSHIHWGSMNIQQVTRSLSLTLLGKPFLHCSAKLEGVLATDAVLSHCSLLPPSLPLLSLYIRLLSFVF